MHETLGDIVGTASERALDSYLEALLIPAERPKVDLGLFLARRAKYQQATNVAWLRGADGSFDDVSRAARLFNDNEAWRAFVDSPDYERIGALVDAYVGS